MFGYVLANPNCMNEEEYERYRGAYCGLCRTLGRRHGQLSRLSLTFDMTFLALFLGALYEPAETTETFRCVMHPKGTHRSVATKYTEYAADMNVLLAYLNFLDDWQDDRSITALVESKLFQRAYSRAAELYPRQAKTVSDALQRLTELEKTGERQLDAGANCFGDLLGELFVYDPNDYWAPRLHDFGYALGKLIYLYDACMDYEKDKKSGSYNPLLWAYPDGLPEETARNLLQMLAGQCTNLFEGLPITQDNGIIKNILYSGVWMRFDEKYGNQGDGSSAT